MRKQALFFSRAIHVDCPGDLQCFGFLSERRTGGGERVVCCGQDEFSEGTRAAELTRANSDVGDRGPSKCLGALGAHQSTETARGDWTADERSVGAYQDRTAVATASRQQSEHQHRIP